jgi:hypothetical protein
MPFGQTTFVVHRPQRGVDVARVERGVEPSEEILDVPHDHPRSITRTRAHGKAAR